MEYGRVLQEHWTGEQDLITIEQDIVPTAEVLPSFTRCRKDWCVYAYQGSPSSGRLYRSLGCTRFSARLQRRFPFKNFVTYEMTWKSCDAYISRVLWSLNFIEPHVHGVVEHRHDYRNDPDNPPASLCKELQPDGRVLVYTNDDDGFNRTDLVLEEIPASWRR
jgi:hypothetical protein